MKTYIISKNFIEDGDSIVCYDKIYKVNKVIDDRRKLEGVPVDKRVICYGVSFLYIYNEKEHSYYLVLNNEEAMEEAFSILKDLATEQFKQ